MKLRERVGARIAGVHPHDLQKLASPRRWSAKLVVDPDELREALRQGWDRDCIEGWYIKADVLAGQVFFAAKPNLVVNSGIFRSLDREYAIGGPPAAVDSMGVDNGTSNPSAATDRSADGSSSSRRIQAFDSTATRASAVVSAVSTYTQATVAFVMKRLFLSSGTGDAAGTLSAMTNVFTMDLSGFSTWSQTFTAQKTGTGS